MILDIVSMVLYHVQHVETAIDGRIVNYNSQGWGTYRRSISLSLTKSQWASFSTENWGKKMLSL